jgi:hypothetical protein
MSSKSSRPPSFSVTGQRRPSGNSVNSNRSLEQFRNSTGGGGLGNLADELENAYEDEGDEESNFLEGLREGESLQDNSALYDLRSPDGMNGNHTNMLQSPLSPGLRAPQNRRQSQNQIRKDSGHQRQDSAYDGSDYGPESESEREDDSCPPILRKRIRDLESLTRACINPEDAVSEGGGTVRRTIQGLKDLGPQANIEYGTTRLITAYTALTSHRTHATRDLFTQAHSLMYGSTLQLLPEEVLEALVTEVTDLASKTPFLRPQNPLLSLQILAQQTDELHYTLRSLTDLLQEFRLVSNAAVRKLKSVRDMVDDMVLEEDLVEQSILLIQAGDWDRRCRERQAATTCQEVCEGFARRWGLDFGGDLVGLAGRKSPAVAVSA